MKLYPILFEGLLKRIGYYPGSFKPFHRGHYESILAAKDKVDELYVVASTADRVRPGEFPLSGEASKIYLQDYIKPALEQNGIKLVLVEGTPVKYTLDAIVEMDDRSDVEIYLFAGEQDLARYNESFLLRAMPNLMSAGKVKIEPTQVIMSGENRISGTRMRKAIQQNDLETFKTMLPDISNVQDHAQDIMDLFKQQGEQILRRNQEEKDRKAAEKDAKKAATAAKKKKKTV